MMGSVSATEWPSVYKCKFLEAGIVSYEDSDSGIALLKKETIDKMASSFIGKPVLISHKKVDPTNYKEHSVGYVIHVNFNHEDGWYYCDFIITDEEAKKLIDVNNYSVSCAYTVLDAQDGGLWHDIKYDGEITDGAFTHLALVENPRYEGSEITKQLPAMLVNGKTAHFINQKEDTTMLFDFMKKKADGTKEKVSDLLIVQNGKEYPLSEVLNTLIEKVEKLNAEGEMKGIKAKDTDLVDINGVSYNVATLKNAMEEKLKKDEEAKNAKEEEEKKAKELEAKKNEKTPEEIKAEEEKKNAAEKEEKEKIEVEAKKKNEKEEEEKKNAKTKKEGEEFFNSLHDLSLTNGDGSENAAPLPLTRQDRANKKREQVGKQFANR